MIVDARDLRKRFPGRTLRLGSATRSARPALPAAPFSGRVVLSVLGSGGALLVLLAACAQESPRPEQATPAVSETERPAAPAAGQQVPPPPANSGQGATGMQWTVPAGWKEQTPTSAMRKAQFEVPGAAGSAELVVFYFGPNQGGDAISNARRWAGQFQKPDGSPALDAMTTKESEFNGMKTLLTEVEGVYRNTMVGDESFPDYKLLGAIVEGPDANWFFKLTGPKATIEASRESFLGFLGSLHPGS